MPYRKPDDQRVNRHRPITLARVSDGPPSRPPSAPKSLAAAGKARWRSLWRSQAGSWLDVEQDSALVARYCGLVDQEAELRRLIGEEGMMATGSKGQSVAHPAVLMLRQVERAELQLEMALGLSPQGRARLGLNVAALRREQQRREQPAAGGEDDRQARLRLRMRAVDPDTVA